MIRVKRSEHLMMQYAGQYLDKLESFEQGVEQGIEQGIGQGKIETAKKLLSMGLSIEQVAQGTDLSLKVVKELMSSKS